MKRIIFTIGTMAFMAAGCNNGDTGKDGKTGAKADSATTATAASVTDVSTSKDTATLLMQNWESREDAQDAELAGGSTNLEMRYRGVSFFPDNTAVFDPRDNIKFGKWALHSKDIDIAFSDGSKGKMSILMLDAKTLILGNKESKKTVEFKADGKMQKQLNDEPFYETNNQWRIKPAKPESDEAIKKRVMDCTQFYHKLLLDKLAKGSTNSTTIFVGLPAIFNIYDGMITVIGKEKLAEKWINCFYNKEQAVKGQQMLEAVITQKYNWDKKERSWLKKDAPVLQQIYDNLAAAK